MSRYATKENMTEIASFLKEEKAVPEMREEYLKRLKLLSGNVYQSTFNPGAGTLAGISFEDAQIRKKYDDTATDYAPLAVEAQEFLKEKGFQLWDDFILVFAPEAWGKSGETNPMLHSSELDIVFKIAKTTQYNNFICTLIHECAHVDQHSKRMLSPAFEQDGGVDGMHWQGKLYNKTALSGGFDAYQAFPWEVDARERAVKLAGDLKAHLSTKGFVVPPERTYSDEDSPLGFLMSPKDSFVRALANFLGED